MKKTRLLLCVSLLMPFFAAAQSGLNYVENSLQQSFNLDGIAAVLKSPYFQFLIGIIIGTAAILWLIYLLGSFKMAYNGLEYNLLRKLWFIPRSNQQRLNAEMPHTSIWKGGRVDLIAQAIMVGHKSDTAKDPENGAPNSEPSRGKEQQQRG